MAFLKSLYLFIKTLIYFIYSFFKPKEVLELKQKWAKDIITGLGYKVLESGTPPSMTETRILVGNHISYLDIMVLMSLNKNISFVAKKEVKSWPIIGPAAARVGTLFVDRSKLSDRKKVRVEISEELRNKIIHVTVFPSGTTTLDENLPWKKGIFEIAHEHKVPVKIFRLSYNPLRESAYIDEDSLVGQMSLALKIKNKSAHVEWLDEMTITDPVTDAEKARLITVQTPSTR